MPDLASYPQLNPANAAGRILAMALTGFLVFVCAVFFRWPGIGKTVIMVSEYCVFMNYDFSDPWERGRRIFSVTLAGGLFQWVLSALEQNLLLLPAALFSGIVLLCFLFRNESSLALIMVIAGVLSLAGSGGAVSGGNQFLFLQFCGLWAWIGIACVRSLFVWKDDLRASAPKKTLNGQRIFTLAFFVTFGILLWKWMQMPQGNWIAFTILLSHLNGVFGDRSLLRVSVRVIMGPLGFLAGFLILGVCCWFDYRIAYLFPLFLVAGFYVYFLRGSYRWNMFFQMIFFVLFYDVMNGEYKSFDVLNLLICRTAAILLGGLLALFGDPEREHPVEELFHA